jgi:hypothetical protein
MPAIAVNLFLTNTTGHQHRNQQLETQLTKNANNLTDRYRKSGKPARQQEQQRNSITAFNSRQSAPSPVLHRISRTDPAFGKMAFVSASN